LWLCQRLFTKKQFSKVQPILCALLASRKPMLEDEIYFCLRTRYPSMSKEDFVKRMHVLRRVLIVSSEGHHILFHHSFSEWFLDVKYCTQKYLCQASEGHLMKGLVLSSSASELEPHEVTDLAYHLLNSSKFFSDPNLISIFLLSLGIKVFGAEFELHAHDHRVQKILSSCGVKKELPQDVDATAVSSVPSCRHGSETCLDEGGGEAPCENPEDSALLSGPGEEPVDPESAAEIGILADMNQVDCNHRTPLHNAANDGNLPVVELLINRGAALEVSDRHGRTPLNLAARQVMF